MKRFDLSVGKMLLGNLKDLLCKIQFNGKLSFKDDLLPYSEPRGVKGRGGRGGLDSP